MRRVSICTFPKLVVSVSAVIVSLLVVIISPLATTITPTFGWNRGLPHPAIILTIMLSTFNLVKLDAMRGQQTNLPNVPRLVLQYLL